MVVKILAVFAVILAVLSAVIVSQPSEFRVVRSVSISASPETVFAEVNDLRRWEAWSPWAKLDPSSTSSFEGPSSGTGAVMRWAGNSQVGVGSMTITESLPNERIRFHLEFLKPFKGTHTAEFTFQPQNGGTVVAWSMSGSKNFIAKAIGLVLHCDKMLGGQFEKGLANLKSITENKNI